MDIATVCQPSESPMRRAFAAASRTTTVLLTSAAVVLGLVQGISHAAPPHSVPIKTGEFTFAVSGKGCRVGNSYRVDASSAVQARNIVSNVLRSGNGQNNGVPIQMASTYQPGQLQFTVTAFSDVRGVATRDCIAQKVAPHKGRTLGQIPSWVKGILAALAATALYVAVAVLATAATELATGGTASLLAAIIGGCVAGAASAFAANYIYGTTNKSKLIRDSLYGCLVSAVAGGALGGGIRRMETWITESATMNAMRARAVTWLGNGLGTILADTRTAITSARQRLHL
ncbi:hypothetical protein [Lentzea sp. HUAS12]|uniref:hypothetical protein n=1 Tax=Lentzea sp. HUAS12 TaxID=2951806 RepID=UPI00209F1158|nr:hypothetical protein [Lentzea sp. HUAS12]USX56252.1 hypothetical protein ND450_19765 [Lentzea sp. HUAS12]